SLCSRGCRLGAADSRARRHGVGRYAARPIAKASAVGRPARLIQVKGATRHFVAAGPRLSPPCGVGSTSKSTTLMGCAGGAGQEPVAGVGEPQLVLDRSRAG